MLIKKSTTGVEMVTASQFAHRYRHYSIELDCPPGNPRPNDLFPLLLTGTPLSPADFDTEAPFFGHQTWILREDAGKDDAFTANKPLFKERITMMYNKGAIRYGSW